MLDRRLLAGAGFALLSAAGFSALTVFAVLSYRDGVNSLGAVIVRFPGAIIVLSAILFFSSVSMRLVRRDLLTCWGLGVLVGAQSYTLYKSFEAIPVGLTMIIFYVYPIIVGVVAGVTGLDRMSRALAGALADGLMRGDFTSRMEGMATSPFTPTILISGYSRNIHSGQEPWVARVISIQTLRSCFSASSNMRSKSSNS